MYPQLTKEVQEGEILLRMNTTMGTIEMKLFPEQAPKTVENFVTHAKNGYYDGTIFHRVINGFMIQGGDPLGSGFGGESIYGAPFEDEFHEDLYNLRGALSMANAGPNTNGSQFFIVQAKDAMGIKPGTPDEIVEAYKEHGGTPHLDGAHTVFGQVIEGMDVVDAIAAVPTMMFGDKPHEDVTIQSIEVVSE